MSDKREVGWKGEENPQEASLRLMEPADREDQIEGDTPPGGPEKNVREMSHRY